MSHNLVSVPYVTHVANIILYNSQSADYFLIQSLISKMEKQLGVARTAPLGCYEDKKSKQAVEKCTDSVMKELSTTPVTISRSLIRVYNS